MPGWLVGLPGWQGARAVGGGAAGCSRQDMSEDLCMAQRANDARDALRVEARRGGAAASFKKQSGRQ